MEGPKLAKEGVSVLNSAIFSRAGNGVIVDGGAKRELWRAAGTEIGAAGDCGVRLSGTGSVPNTVRTLRRRPLGGLGILRIFVATMELA